MRARTAAAVLLRAVAVEAARVEKAFGVPGTGTLTVVREHPPGTWPASLQVTA